MYYPIRYHGYGYAVWTPYAPYPLQNQWALSTPLVRYPAPTPLPTAAPYIPLRDFGAGVGYYQQVVPPTPARYTHPRAPDRANLQDEDDFPAVIPSRSPSPDHHRRPVRIRSRTGHHTLTRLTVDPILALPDPPFGALGLQWDLADNPIRTIFDHPDNTWIQRRDPAHAAACDGSRELERLVLVFAGLPRECGAEIEVAHTHPVTMLGAVDEDVPWVTVYDVFVEIFLWLVSPIGEDEMGGLEGRRFDGVIRTAEARRRWRAGRPASVGRAGPYLKIDYLGERRRFKGMRPALRDEVPVGRRFGEVFVIELGASE